MNGKLHWWTGTAVLLTVLITLQTATLSAQGDARFTGTVRDMSGATVPGATVVVRNDRTGEERTATSSPDGTYSVGSLKGTSVNQIQPEQPYTEAAAGTFRKLTSTVGRTVGLGTNRQAQFALRLSF